LKEKIVMRIRTLVAFLAMLCLTTGLLAQETKESKAAAEEKAMMEAWMKASTPNDNHKAMEPMVGTFNTKVKAWMAPGAPVMESTGVSENTWALGGRYVQMMFKGSFMNMPFEGIGYTGYDNMKKQYISYWLDNMSTWGMVTTGKWDAATKSMTFEGTSPDPMTGKDTMMKEKVTIVDNNKHLMEMWSPGPDGKMFKMMEIEYTRK
jgi:hypothetical protein